MTDLSDQKKLADYRMKNKVRFVTAASLFDGHDPSINIMRRILQAQGAEVIDPGHNRPVREIVDCALPEDAHGSAVSSYQAGHAERDWRRATEGGVWRAALMTIPASPARSCCTQSMRTPSWLLWRKSSTRPDAVAASWHSTATSASVAEP